MVKGFEIWDWEVRKGDWGLKARNWEKRHYYWKNQEVERGLRKFFQD